MPVCMQPTIGYVCFGGFFSLILNLITNSKFNLHNYRLIVLITVDLPGHDKVQYITLTLLLLLF